MKMAGDVLGQGFEIYLLFPVRTQISQGGYVFVAAM